MDHSECREQINALEARARGAEVLSRHLEETQKDNALLRHHIAMYDEVMARVQNRLEVFASAEHVPASSRTMVDCLLEKNQHLNIEIMLLRQQLELQGAGEKIEDDQREEMVAENESLRAQVEELKLILSDIRTANQSGGESSLLSRLERAEKMARTKTALCELLAAQLEQGQACESHRQKIEHLERLNAEYRDQIKSIETNNRITSQELAERIDQIATLNEAQNQRQNEINAMQAQLRMASAHAEEVERSRRATEKELANLQTVLVTIKQQNLGLNRQIAECRIEHLQQIQKLEEEAKTETMAAKLQAEEYHASLEKEKELTASLREQIIDLTSRRKHGPGQRTLPTPVQYITPRSPAELVPRSCDTSERKRTPQLYGLHQAVADSPVELKLCKRCKRSVPIDTISEHLQNNCQ